ncbi:2-dehydropantoate 2-reductase [Paenarthrobacter sp. Z7-10]|uniref:ketopantoate reductase family protein n=1 Tax=Paenarthrobacter sp. Z7-10 TaxID=2787635 RepID=UPI0022A92639|nr:2-dehydropantoate 2-reductase [Paenarthrobacter sp. Z7-10]MCZ2402215.1 2-dehydropantoate 2-reductase [Paenarthrobacter sp. Z7-10]
MRIAVIGAGGVGGYFGARLAAGGNDVMFVARGAHLHAINEHGLRVNSALGDEHVIPASAVADASEVESAELVILAVKLWDTEAAATQIAPLVAGGAQVMSLQNGISKDELLASRFPREQILGGACYISAVIDSPGVISHDGTLQRLVFGDYGDAASPQTLQFLQACRASGIDAQLSDDIELELWQKYVFLVGLSATTAATRLPIGPILANERSRQLLLEVMQEVVTLGRKRGVNLDPSYADHRLEFCAGLPPTMTSSMYHDLIRGNRLELPWLSTTVAAASADLGLAAPRNATIADILAPFENPVRI